MTGIVIYTLTAIQAAGFAIWMLRKPHRARRLAELARYGTSNYATRNKQRLAQHRVWLILRGHVK